MPKCEILILSGILSSANEGITRKGENVSEIGYVWYRSADEEKEKKLEEKEWGQDEEKEKQKGEGKGEAKGEAKGKGEGEGEEKGGEEENLCRFWSFSCNINDDRKHRHTETHRANRNVFHRTQSCLNVTSLSVIDSVIVTLGRKLEPVLILSWHCFHVSIT